MPLFFDVSDFAAHYAKHGCCQGNLCFYDPENENKDFPKDKNPLVLNRNALIRCPGGYLRAEDWQLLANTVVTSSSAQDDEQQVPIEEPFRIHKIRLDKFDVGNEGMKALSRIMMAHDINDLYFWSCRNIPATGLQLVLKKAGAKKQQCLSSLSIIWCSIYADCGAVLAKHLLVNKALKTLNLGATKLTNQACRSIAKALMNNNNNVCATLQNLDLSLTDLKFDGQIAFIEGLAENTSLRRLEIHHSELSANVWVALADALCKNRTIKLFQMGWSKVSLHGWKALTRIIHYNKGIQALYIPGMEPIGCRSGWDFDLFAQALAINKSIHTISFCSSNTAFGNKVRNSVADALIFNKNLLKLDDLGVSSKFRYFLELNQPNAAIRRETLLKDAQVWLEAFLRFKGDMNVIYLLLSIRPDLLDPAKAKSQKRSSAAEKRNEAPRIEDEGSGKGKQLDNNDPSGKSAKNTKGKTTRQCHQASRFGGNLSGSNTDGNVNEVIQDEGSYCSGACSVEEGSYCSEQASFIFQHNGNSGQEQAIVMSKDLGVADSIIQKCKDPAKKNGNGDYITIPRHEYEQMITDMDHIIEATTEMKIIEAMTEMKKRMEKHKL